MKKVQTELIAQAVANLSRAAANCGIEQMADRVVGEIESSAQKQGVQFSWTNGRLGDYLRGPVSEKLLSMLQSAEEDLKHADFPSRFHAKVARIREAVENDFRPDTEAVRLDELVLDLLDELTEPLSLHIPTGKRALYENASPPFGPEVEATFPDAKVDIEAASRCLALDEWTACVFHSMRVLEHGLRVLANRFAVPFKTDSWHTVLTGVERGIDALRNKQGLTDRDRGEITFYSDAATEFRYFKDAWRNHVSHARTHYDEREATKIYAHVRDFMRQMSAPP